MKHLWWFNYGDAVHHSQCRRSLLMLWGLKEIEFNWLIVAAITDREIHYTNEHQQITLANREEPLHFSKYFSMRYWMKTLILTLSWLLTRTRTSRTWWWILVMRSVNCKTSDKLTLFIAPNYFESILRQVHKSPAQVWEERLSPSLLSTAWPTSSLTAFTDFMQTLTFMRPLPQVIGSSGNCRRDALPPSVARTREFWDKTAVTFSLPPGPWPPLTCSY